MTSADLLSTTIERVGDAVGDTMYYSVAETQNALNACQRLFCLLTLCLETTGTFALATDGTSSYQMLSEFADWLLPLRIRIVNGAKLALGTISDLGAIDDNWRLTRGTPQRYAVTGFGLLSTYPQASSPATLSITYARCPDPMGWGSDVPEIPAEYHINLIDGAIPMLRSKEGAQEWQKIIDQWDRFIAACRHCGERIRARNRELGYDAMPAELERYDTSRLMKRGA